MNRQTVIGTALLAGALALVCGPSTPQAVARQARPAVRIGLANSLFRNTPEPLMQVLMRPFKALLEAQVGMTGELVLGGDACALGHKLKNDEVQLAVFHGVEFAWAKQKYPDLKPLIVAVNRNRHLRAVAVVRADRKADCCADLKGKVAALSQASREHCRLYFERRCCQDGPPAKFFSEVTAPADAEDALDDVVDGKADLTVVDALELEKFRLDKPGRARQLRALAESEPFPCGVVAYLPGRFSEADVQRFRAGMVGARATARGRKLLELLRITSFESVPADYETTLTAIAKAYPAPAPAK